MAIPWQCLLGKDTSLFIFSLFTYVEISHSDSVTVAEREDSYLTEINLFIFLHVDHVAFSREFTLCHFINYA